ncbi:hypothetical protein FA95DRAFT_1578619 [Auriscalpium vulgare]|uniref:Uncharacterized protein n=1 Tax=Auriscalpium vulgare TaxID=40419 RepID=A0ACB8R2J1_9AGAM|nr:hypothetical protein FA95DRAFT_1578619 [Auriscalpium vulgare]
MRYPLGRAPLSPARSSTLPLTPAQGHGCRLSPTEGHLRCRWKHGGGISEALPDVSQQASCVARVRSYTTASDPISADLREQIAAVALADNLADKHATVLKRLTDQRGKIAALAPDEVKSNMTRLNKLEKDEKAAGQASLRAGANRHRPLTNARGRGAQVLCKTASADTMQTTAPVNTAALRQTVSAPVFLTDRPLHARCNGDCDVSKVPVVSQTGPSANAGKTADGAGQRKGQYSGSAASATVALAGGRAKRHGVDAGGRQEKKVDKTLVLKKLPSSVRGPVCAVRFYIWLNVSYFPAAHAPCAACPGSAPSHIHYGDGAALVHLGGGHSAAVTGVELQHQQILVEVKGPALNLNKDYMVPEDQTIVICHLVSPLWAEAKHGHQEGCPGFDAILADEVYDAGLAIIEKRGRMRKLNPAVPSKFEDEQSRKGKVSVGWIDFNDKRRRLESADQDDKDKSHMSLSDAVDAQSHGGRR